MSTVVGWRGVGVEIAGDAALLAALQPQLPPFFRNGVRAVAHGELRAENGQLTLSLPDDLGLSGPDGPETRRACASRIELCLADRLPDLVAVHAGVVAVDGRAVIVPGTSMAGKSTLVRALLADGATYLSDEFALLTPDGRVHAYPRLMTVRTPAGSERVVPSPALPADAPPVPVALVAFVSYSPEGWDVETISPAQAVLGLVENGVNVRREPERAMTAFAALVAQATTVRGVRGEAASAMDHLRPHITQAACRDETAEPAIEVA